MILLMCVRQDRCPIRCHNLRDASMFDSIMVDVIVASGAASSPGSKHEREGRAIPHSDMQHRSTRFTSTQAKMDSPKRGTDAHTVLLWYCATSQSSFTRVEGDTCRRNPIILYTSYVSSHPSFPPSRPNLLTKNHIPTVPGARNSKQ